MNLSDVKLLYTRYKMNKMTLSIPALSEPYAIDRSHISSIIIEKDYDNFMFPFFEIDVVVPNYVYRAMKKKNQELRAFVDLHFGCFNEINYTSTDIPSFSSYITDNFYIFMEEMTPDVSESIIEQKEKDDGTFGKGMNLGDATVVKLLLYREDYLFKSKTLVNAVLSSATLIDALTFVLNKSGMGDVLVTPPNNYKTYQEFIITPISAMEQINRICNEFGMHTNGTLIFFDFKALYIIDKNPRCTAYVPNEYKMTYLTTCPATAQSSTLAKGWYYNTSERYSLLNLDPTTLQIKDFSGINDQIFGNDFINININNGNVKNVVSGATKSKGSLTGPTRVVITTKGDDTSGAIKQQMSEASKILTMGFSYVNLNALNPNKEFIFSVDDTRFTKYAGRYRITKKTVIFQKEGDFFAPHVVAEFKGK